MDTRTALLNAALEVLARDGAAGFSTRAVCSIAQVTAPTLYHHYGSADGLLSAALAEAFRQFLERKKAATQSPDPEEAMRQGWDDYVRFAAERPKLYAAMMSRILQGGSIPAAEEAYRLLTERIAKIAAAGRLAMEEGAAAQVAWAFVNAAAMLHVNAAMKMPASMEEPDADVIDGLRDLAMLTICKPDSREEQP